MATTLVTGANGFVGGPVCAWLSRNGDRVLAATRRPVSLPECENRVVGALDGQTDWSAALAGADRVVHLAARAHVLEDDHDDPLALFRRINRDGAVRLAAQAAEQGVRRFVFVSTIKVNGEATPPDHPFRADDQPCPQDAYGIAKAEAERELAAIAASTGMELVIIRPPLVHGPGVKGNLQRLVAAIGRGLPLPFALIDNRRSLIGVDNLASAIGFCLDAEAAAGQTFLLRDGEDVSTPRLIRMLAAAMEQRCRLLPVPPALLRAMGRLSGRQAAVDRLLGSLVVDDAPLRALGWRPTLSLEQGLTAMVRQG